MWLARRKSDGKTLAVKKIEVRTPWQFPGTASAGEVSDTPWACLTRRALCVRRVLYAQCENFDDANQALTEGKMLLELGETPRRSAHREHCSCSLMPLPKTSQVHCVSRTLAAAIHGARTRVICVSIYVCVCVFLCMSVCVCMCMYVCVCG